MKTKERILDASRKCFNNEGMAKVTLRRIAEFLDMSPGNLTYHFKKKEELEEALYFQLVSFFEVGFQGMQRKEVSLKDHMDFPSKVFDIMFEYRFFFLDFTQFMRKHPKVKAHYEGLSIIRKKQFAASLEMMGENGWVRPELIPGEYDALFQRIQILTDFFLASKIDGDLKDKDIWKEEFLNQFNFTLLPYMTESGMKQMNRVV